MRRIKFAAVVALAKSLTLRWGIAVGYVRLSLLMAWAIFGACSCAGGDRPEAGLSKPTKITCQAGPDCDAKWARANKWVTESSGLKTQSKAESQIKTVESPDGNSRTLVVTITKTRRPSRAFTRSALLEGAQVS